MTLNYDNLRARIDAALREHIEPATHSPIATSPNSSPFSYLGVRTPHTRHIATVFFRELRSYGIKDIDTILNYCEDLLTEYISEYRTIAFQWSFKCQKQFLPKHFELYERWLNVYVSGWGSCDDFCTHTLGSFLFQFPAFIPRVKTWTTSSNSWVRRASAVTFIYALRRGMYLPYVFEIADKLLMDPDIYVLKGYGWMLKEASKHFQEEVFQYICTHKAVMPRVSLRYAIEKMPRSMRKEAMKK